MTEALPVYFSVGRHVTTTTYDLTGRAIALSLGNGQQQDNHYDGVGKLIARHLFNPNQTLIATFTWQHDAVGNVTSQTERWLGDASRNNALRTTTMAYDDVYRLLGEAVTQSGEVTKDTLYTYDDASNRASKVEKENTVVVKDTTYTYNTANQLTAWSEENGAAVVQRSAVMTYDTRGNRASTAVTTHGETPTTATTSYTWTPQNMLSSVTLPNSSVHSYAYDYRVRRITRTEGSANPVAMTFSGGLSVAEFEVADSQLNTLNSQPTVEYQRGPDMGGGVGGLLYSLRSGTAKFNLSNGRGDVVAQSDASGDLTWTASYEAYGKRPVETGSNLDRQRANTKEEDPTGLLNEGFRYRDLETGTWLSRDPAGFVDGPNLYAYVQQNPWTAFDPLGLNHVVVSGGINPDIKKDDSHDKFWGNFVRAAQTDIEQNKDKLGRGEQLEWHVQRSSLEDRAKMEGEAVDFYTQRVENIAKSNGVSLRWFNDTKEFVSGINTDLGGQARTGSSCISNFRFYGHGIDGAIWLTYVPAERGGQPTGGHMLERSDLQTAKNWRYKVAERTINASAFTNDATCLSWACNTATGTAGDPSFADSWAASLGIPMKGLVGKSDYGPTSPAYGDRSWTYVCDPFKGVLGFVPSRKRPSGLPYYPILGQRPNKEPSFFRESPRPPEEIRRALPAN